MAENKKKNEFRIPGPQYDCKGFSLKTKTTLYMEINNYRTGHIDLEAADVIETIEREIQFAYASGKRQTRMDLGEMLGVKG